MTLRPSRSSSQWLRFFWSSLFAYSVFGIAAAQDAFSNLPALPSGFYEAAATVIGEQEELRLGELDLSLSLQTLYDTNVRQGNDFNEQRPVLADFRFQPTLAGTYTVRVNNWQLGASGNLGKIVYRKLKELNADNHRAAFFGKYQMSNFAASFQTGFDTTGRLNRFAGEFVERDRLRNSLMIAYQLSPKTSTELSWNSTSVNTDTGGFASTLSQTLQGSVLWQATPLLRLGPGFRYAERSSSENAEINLAGPQLRAVYDLPSKLSMSSNVGRAIDVSSKGERELLNWQVSLNYKATMWGFGLGMRRQTRTTLISGAGFDQVSGYSFNYNHRIRRARLKLGVAYIEREPQGTNDVAREFRDSTSIDYTASLALPIINNDLDLQVNLAWRDLKTSEGLRSWNGFESELALKWNF